MIKKILHLGKFYPPDYGGIESVTQSILDNSNKDFKHTVICFAKNKEDSYIKSPNIIRCKPFVTIKNQPLSFKYLFEIVKRFNTSDIIHIHSPNILAYIALIFCKNKNIITHWHSDVLNKGNLYKIIRPIETYMLKRSKYIIATSRKYADASQPLKKFSSKIKIIPLGIKDLESSESKFSESPVLKNIKTKKIILSVGRLVDYKGFDLILEAAKYFSKDIISVIVGSGPEYNKLLELKNKNKIDNVYILQNVSNLERNYLYKKCDLFCLPSKNRQEAFGVVLLEALSSGKPILSNIVQGSGMNWINKNNETGLNIDMKDSMKFANTINSLMIDKDQLHTFSRNSRHRYINKFTDKIMIANLEKLYYELFSSSK